MIELRSGPWQYAFRYIRQVDAVITDPPYSERTAKGQRGNRKNDGSWLGTPKHSGITYGFLTENDVNELVDFWTPITRRWFVMFGDHVTVGWALARLKRNGWYHFPPVPWTKTGAAPRIAADGPSPQSEFLAIARPVRKMVKPELRYRPGWYHGTSRGGVKGFIGSKPQWIFDDLVRDYSEPGDLIADPYTGSGTLLLSARAAGRSAIGSERDEQTYRCAYARVFNQE